MTTNIDNYNLKVCLLSIFNMPRVPYSNVDQIKYCESSLFKAQAFLAIKRTSPRLSLRQVFPFNFFHIFSFFLIKNPSFHIVSELLVAKRWSKNLLPPLSIDQVITKSIRLSMTVFCDGGCQLKLTSLFSSTSKRRKDHF